LLLVVTTLDVGGAEKCCVQLATGLDRERWQVEVCSVMRPGAMANPLRDAGIPVHSLDASRPWHAPLALVRLARLMRRTRPDVVHTFLFHANVLGRLAAQFAGRPRVVASIRVAERRFRHHLVLENLTFRLSDRAACVSRGVARFVRRRCYEPAGRLVVIPNGVDVTRAAESASARTRLGPGHDACVAIYVGRLDPQKGVDVLLRAVAVARTRAPHLTLLLVGAGPQRQALEQLAAELQLSTCVKFLGWRPDATELMQAADLLVLPSRWEGMPNVVLEAMAAGLPVVATRAEGTAELVRHRETGLLVAIDDVNELAGAIAETAGAPELRTSWGVRGQAIALNDFSVEQMVQQYQQVYASLLESTGPDAVASR
jgi:glycosyltransferase involved in cell wall biosynthesis